MTKTSSVWVLVAMLIVSTGTAFASGGDWKMGPFGPYWDDNDWPEFTPMYWMEEFMNRLDDDDDDIRDWMRMQQYSNQFGPGVNYPWQPYGDWGAPYTTDRFWEAPVYRDAPIYRRYPYPSGRGWRDGTRRDSRILPYYRDGRLPELTPEEYRRLPQTITA